MLVVQFVFRPLQPISEFDWTHYTYTFFSYTLFCLFVVFSPLCFSEWLPGYTIRSTLGLILSHSQFPVDQLSPVAAVPVTIEMEKREREAVVVRLWAGG